MTQLSDEILIAYADGELGPSQIRVVDGVLSNDGVTLKQFQQVTSTNKRLSQAFASMLQVQTRQIRVRPVSREAQPRPQAPKVANGAATSRNILVPAVAASVVLIAVGAMGGYLAGNNSNSGPGNSDPFNTANFWQKERLKSEAVRSKTLAARSEPLLNGLKGPRTTAATKQSPPDSTHKWYEAIADRHKLDAVSLLDRYDGKSRNRDMALFKFSNTQIAPTMIPLLNEEELVFVGASPVQIGGVNYAQLAYRDIGNGAVPVGLYVGNSKGGSLTLERGYRGKDNYVRWTQGARSYMLIGSVPHWRLIVLSVAVQRQLVR